MFDMNGVIQLDALKAYVHEQGLELDDRRIEKGGLWITSVKGARLNADTKYGRRLKELGFQWSDIRGAWFFRQ